jgi:response regulator RpfG family c-di-GMP phosphodiesterase
MLKGTNTILVVDDDPVNLKLLERLLKREFRVLTADNGTQALEILNREPISLIMTDQQMPDMSGIELLQKSRAINESMVRMVVTANRDSKTFVEAIRAAGAVRVITKPWDPERVKQDVREALGRFTLEAERTQAIQQLKQKNEELRRLVRRQ